MAEKSWPLVTAQKAETYAPELIDRTVTQILDTLNVKERLSPDMKVTIKPNLLMKRRPEQATTAHPSVVEAVIRYVQKARVTDITVADSPGGPYTKPLLHGIYEATGMIQVCQKTGAVLNEDTGFGTVPAPEGKQCASFSIIDPVRKADFIISIGKLKTHCMTTMTGGVKNLFGCVPGLQKPELHYRFQDKKDFCNMLVDLAGAVCPDVTLVDAVIGMEGDGPSAGTPIRSGFIGASDSPFVLDRYLSHLIGFEPQEVPTVEASIQRGLCPEKVEDIPLLTAGMPEHIPFKKPASHAVNFMSQVPAPLRPVVSAVKDHFLTPRPKVHKNQCIGCGRCAQNCPAHTIEIVDKKAVICYDNCIRCYCCHELCPVQAIHIQRIRLFDL